MTPSPTQPVPPKPRWDLVLLSGGLALLGWPLGLFALALRAIPLDPEDRVSSPLARAWAEGGSWMYIVAGLALLVTPVCAVLAMVAARRTALAAAVLPLLGALPAAVGTAGRDAAMQGALAAVEHVSPADRHLILLAATSEAQWVVTFGALMSAGLLVALCCSALAAWRAQARSVDSSQPRALLAGALLLPVLAALALIGGLGARSLGDALQVLANVAQLDAPAVAQELLPGLQAFERAFAGAAVAAMVGLLVLAWRMGPGLRPRLAWAASFVCGLGLLGLSAQPQLPGHLLAAMRGEGRPPERLRFDAPPAAEAQGFDIEARWDDQARAQLQAGVELQRLAANATPFALSLTPQASQLALGSALEFLAQHGVRSVLLLTGREPRPPLPSPFDLLEAPSSGVSLSLDYRAERCADPCTLARLTAEALEVDQERWPLEERADRAVPLDGEPVFLAFEPRPPRELLRAALTAMKRGRPLELLLEGARPTQRSARPTARSDDASESEATAEGWAPLAKFEVLKVSVQGPLEQATARTAILATVEGLESCVTEEYERARLPLSLNVELVVSSDGAVSLAEPANPDDALEECASRVLRSQAEFSPPRKRGLSLVRIALKATARQRAPTP